MSSDSARAVSDEPDFDPPDTVEPADLAQSQDDSESPDSAEYADQDATATVADDGSTSDENGDSDEGINEGSNEGSNEDGNEDTAVASGSGDSGDRRGPLPKRLVLGSAALTLAAFIVAAVFGIMWLVTVSGDRAELASSRDAVVDAARDAIPAVTELDSQNPDSFFERSKAVSTDQFGNQLGKVEDSLRQGLAKADTSVNTEVSDVAVQELNDHEGTATFLAVIKTDISQGDRNVSKILRLKGQMQRVSQDGEQEWKLAGLSQVPVVGGGAKGQNPGNGSNGQNQQGSSQGSQQQSDTGSGSGN